jgi:hypothetical protein
METDAYIVSCLSVCVLSVTVLLSAVSYAWEQFSSLLRVYRFFIAMYRWILALEIVALAKRLFYIRFQETNDERCCTSSSLSLPLSSYFSLSLTICRCVPSLLAMKWIESGLSVTECGMWNFSLCYSYNLEVQLWGIHIQDCTFWIFHLWLVNVFWHARGMTMTYLGRQTLCLALTHIQFLLLIGCSNPSRYCYENMFTLNVRFLCLFPQILIGLLNTWYS